MTLNKHTVIYGCTRMSANAEPWNRRRSLNSFPQRIRIHLWTNQRCCPLCATIADNLVAPLGATCGVRCTLYSADTVPTEHNNRWRWRISKPSKNRRNLITTQLDPELLALVCTIVSQIERPLTVYFIESSKDAVLMVPVKDTQAMHDRINFDANGAVSWTIKKDMQDWERVEWGNRQRSGWIVANPLVFWELT